MVLWLLASVPLASALDAGELAPKLEPIEGRVSLVNFWASWCGPCRAELPALNALGERLDDGYAVVTINVDVEDRRAKALLSKLSVELPVVWDPVGAVASEWAPPAMPTSYLVDAAGRVVEVIPRGLEDSEFEALEARMRALEGA